MKILVRGKSTRIPMKSVMKPGINRKNPPIGVNRVFKKLSAVGSIDVLLTLMSSNVFKPLLRSK